MIRRGLYGVLLVIGLIFLGLSIHTAQAFPAQQDGDSIVSGAMLYDKWYAAKGTDAPSGNMPLWASQTTNTRSGPETWRCVTCHGWDYQGREGAYRYGSHYTGFPGVYQARGKSVEEITAALNGSANPQHDFSQYLSGDEIGNLAIFIREGVIDDNEFIDPTTLNVKDGDSAHGKQLYDSTCASCHGPDGKQIEFDFEGRTAWLGGLAQFDPWRFLHKTRFGTPGTHMAVGFNEGWTPQDGRDVLVYARSFPTNLETATQPPSMEGRDQPQGRAPGGPASNLFTGILTALGAMAASLGFAVLIGGLLVGVILLLVWLLRGQNK